MISFASSLILLLLLAGCDRHTGAAATQPTLPTTQMSLGAEKFTLEIADDNDSRETGLMYRDFMPADHGMIFVFDDETDRNFWMRNTRIPLDILFLDHDGKIVSIHSMKPYDLSTTPSDAPAKFAIELNVGEADATKLHPGDLVAIPPSLPHAR